MLENILVEKLNAPRLCFFPCPAVTLVIKKCHIQEIKKKKKCLDNRNNGFEAKKFTV